ncbi:unnamed protein product [Hydatigera taeniaeformis]|uniref:Uncharacterized protein n=1 Tax=Hydatigena taeniaeformis TaxID=6205 RepID=A0A158REP3_HYDTA|nr:unnamed protein product [Hydatigera taeniaeformis]
MGPPAAPYTTTNALEPGVASLHHHDEALHSSSVEDWRGAEAVALVSRLLTMATRMLSRAPLDTVLNTCHDKVTASNVPSTLHGGQQSPSRKGDEGGTGVSERQLVIDSLQLGGEWLSVRYGKTATEGLQCDRKRVTLRADRIVKA